MVTDPSRGSEAPAPLTRRTSPVFVDRSGRRVRRIRVAAIAGVTALGLSLGLVVVSVLGVPTVVSPLLPSRAPAADASSPVAPQPQASTPAPAPEPSANPRDGSRDADADASATPDAAVEPARAAATAPSPIATEAATPGNAPPVADRGNSEAAPGRANAPTEPAKP
ncbi:hypothetical protein JNB62_16940 [Microbacterium jejuense]|uniref:Uncharacterized protein n=1 Tax=Microbacterium jejuense TaxID=1263637 RepID=A0ABS7HQX9_9MICO|nr:hypothetical protein [Microbacterium jejuense]MBW9095371.1 hypothetical protein [Microbacterium jejuense]